MFRFHGGCIGCTLNIRMCPNCRYFQANWELPDLNPHRKDDGYLSDLREKALEAHREFYFPKKVARLETKITNHQVIILFQWIILIGVMIGALIFLSGCNDTTVELNESGYRRVTFHQVSRAELKTMSDNPDVQGHAEWDEWDCDIYLMPQSQYLNTWDYVYTMNHELRHCSEGNFHD